MQKMKEKGLNQAELSKLLGIPKNTCRVGKRKIPPTTYYISEICSAFGRTLDYYL